MHSTRIRKNAGQLDVDGFYATPIEGLQSSRSKSLSCRLDKTFLPDFPYGIGIA